MVCVSGWHSYGGSSRHGLGLYSGCEERARRICSRYFMGCFILRLDTLPGRAPGLLCFLFVPLVLAVAFLFLIAPEIIPCQLCTVQHCSRASSPFLECQIP